jgi:hypothetical protein
MQSLSTFTPLFRPFVLGFAILIFPSVIAMINAVLSPTVRGTAGLVKDSDKAIALLLKKKEDAIKSSDFWQMYVGDDQKGSREKWLKYTYGDGYSEGFTDGIANDIKFYMAKQSYNFRNSIKAALSEILRVVFESASLCVNTIRTFYLIVMAIIGPIAFGIAVFDGFQHTLTSWIARYINIFLWLPVANIFGAIIGKIQEKMISLDIRQVQQNGDTFFSSHDMAYLVFSDHWHCRLLLCAFGRRLHHPGRRRQCIAPQNDRAAGQRSYGCRQLRFSRRGRFWKITRRKKILIIQLLNCTRYVYQSQKYRRRIPAHQDFHTGGCLW